MVNGDLITETVLCQNYKSKHLFSHTLGLYISVRKNLNNCCQSVADYYIFKSVYVQIGKYFLLLMASIY